MTAVAVVKAVVGVEFDDKVDSAESSFDVDVSSDDDGDPFNLGLPDG